MGIITLDISSRANQPPSSSGWLSLSLQYNQLYSFTLANFTTETTPAYADPEGDLLHSIRVVSLPEKGLLKKSNTPVLVGDVVTAAELSSGILKYQADSSDVNGYSDGYMSFTVSDSGSFTYTTFPKVVSISLKGNVNNPPLLVGSGEADISIGQTLVFNRGMLTSQLNPPYLDPDGDAASKLLIVSVPLSGSFLLNNVPIVNNQEIDFTDIDAGLFSYRSDGYPTGGIEGFEFKISDVGSGEYVG